MGSLQLAGGPTSRPWAASMIKFSKNRNGITVITIAIAIIVATILIEIRISVHFVT